MLWVMSNHWIWQPLTRIRVTNIDVCECVQATTCVRTKQIHLCVSKYAHILFGCMHLEELFICTCKYAWCILHYAYLCYNVTINQYVDVYKYIQNWSVYDCIVNVKKKHTSECICTFVCDVPANAFMC